MKSVSGTSNNSMSDMTFLLGLNDLFLNIFIIFHIIINKNQNFQVNEVDKEEVYSEDKPAKEEHFHYLAENYTLET